MEPSTRTVVEYFGAQEDRHCGYCKSDDPNRFTHGMWAHEMTVQVYQDILDRGLRRSGKYCYKPDMKKTCCPQYTIRCDAPQFRPSRSQKRVVRSLNKFLSTGVLPKRASYDVDVDLSAKKTLPEAGEGTEKAKNKKQDCPAEEKQRRDAKTEVSRPHEDDRRQRKAKYRRQQRALEKLRAKGIVIDSFPPRPPPTAKPIESILSFAEASNATCLKVEGTSHYLEIRLVRSSPASEEFKRTFQKSAEIFKRYQETIHNDEDSESTFRRFLVDSPLKPLSGEHEQHPGYGSFHQQYWLDGKQFIAVGVLDILPNCVSSKYFYYDPDFRSLSLGVYSALQEIALVRRLQSYSPSLRYYYMGYYIHSCPKMRYKGRYRPSDLLCPETYTWHRIEQCQTKLDASKYSRFDQSGLTDADADIDLESVLVLFQRRLMDYPTYKSMKYGRSGRNDQSEVKEYASILGRKAAPCVILYRSDED